jgi:hypothetical protein
LLSALPELKGHSRSIRPEENYVDFYFGNHSIAAAVNNGGLICLHNSWTPEKYKAMSEEEFLRQNVTLADILRFVLFGAKPSGTSLFRQWRNSDWEIEL